MTEIGHESADTVEIRRLIGEWAEAVRRRDLAGVLRHHAADIVMFDVPPPFQSVGIEAYKETWSLFFGASPEPAVFDLRKLDVIASPDVAFCCRHDALQGARRHSVPRFGLSAYDRFPQDRGPMDLRP